LGPTHYWRHKPLDGFHQFLGATKLVALEHQDVLNVWRNEFDLRDRIDFPDIADLVFESRMCVDPRVVGNQPDTPAFTRNPADASAAAAPGFRNDKNFHGAA